MTDGRYHGQLGLVYCPCNALVIKCPKVFYRTAAAARYYEIGNLIFICVTDSPDDLGRSLDALHTHRQKNDLGHRPAPAEYTDHIVYGSACRGGDDSDLARKRRERLFMARVEQPLRGQLGLELLICYLKIPCALGNKVGAIELVRSVTREHRYTPKSSDAHAAFRAKTELGRTAFEHDAS